MVLSWNDIAQWSPSEVGRLAQRVTEAARAFDAGADVLTAAAADLDWQGAAADAARHAISVLHRGQLDRARELGAIGRCIARLADSMYPLLSVVRDCNDTAARHDLTIHPNGAVAAQFPVYAVAVAEGWETERDRLRLRRELGARVSESMRRALEIDDATTAALNRIDGGGEGGSDSDDDTGVAAEHTSVRPARAVVPSGGTAAANSAFWKSLTPAERTSLMVLDPGSIGNLDGIPAQVRDAANRRMLTLERTRLEAVAQDLGRQLERNRFGGLFDNADAGLSQTRKRLAALDSIASTLDQGGRQLLVLDNSSSEDTLAAIAVGNVHTATHVAVFVPGLGSDVRDDLHRYDGDVAALQRTAEDLLPDGDSVACVTWMNYQAPHMGWSLLDPSRTVISPLAASRGAPRLTAFLDGLDAARGPDPHLTLLGHSYGSLVASLSLRGADTAGVDEFVAAGSPGLGFDDSAGLSVPPGHLFVAEARGDLVADLGAFGADPGGLGGIETISTEANAAQGTSENVGHSDYLTPGTTAQRETALVVTGQSQEVTG